MALSLTVAEAGPGRGPPRRAQGGARSAPPVHANRQGQVSSLGRGLAPTKSVKGPGPPPLLPHHQHPRNKAPDPQEHPAHPRKPPAAREDVTLAPPTPYTCTWGEPTWPKPKPAHTRAHRKLDWPT